MWSLASKDPEHVPIERNMFANLVRREILARVSDEGVYRTIELIVGAVPVQTIVPALIADKFLGKLVGEVGWRVGEVFLLRFDQLAACINGGEFIPADAPEHDLVFARGSVEKPCAVIIDEWNRKRPVLRADN